MVCTYLFLNRVLRFFEYLRNVADKIYFDFIPGIVSTAWIGNREEENKFCQSLCDTCGCVGFGCGDECLCECQQKKADDKCNLNKFI